MRIYFGIMACCIHFCMLGSRILFPGGGGGGGGGSRPTSQKRVWTFFYCFFSPQLILQFTEGSLRFYNRENYTFEGFRGGPTFSKGGPTFSIGDQMLISIETHITCDFPGGGGGPDPLSPLWIRTCFWVS